MSNEQSAQPSKFIFFGCWNNINCDSEFMYRDIVLDYIKKNESDVKQLYIAGDNWYTNKKTINEKELKLYITEVLRTGYDKLYSMGKDIHIAVGNHDIDSNISVGKKLGSAKSPRNAKSPRIPQIPESASSLRIPEIPRSASSPQSVSSSGSASSSQGVNTRKELKKDCNINTQKYYLRKIKNGTKKFETPTLESLREMKDTELSEVALHNQGIYIYVENIGVCDNNDYIVIIINTNKFDDFDEGMLYLEEIREVIKRVKGSESGKQIFVMGHIPLFTNKKNKLSIHEITKKDSRFKEITYKLFDILTEHNIIYLCADTHNFSIMKITHNGKVLIQITAGTGGADPDIIDENPKTEKTEKTENVKDGYEITAYSINSYGYVSINISKGQIDVCYTQVIKAPLPEKSSYTSVQKITYKITKQDPYLTYEHNIEERDYPNNANDANNPIYKPTNICKKINDDTRGYITDKEGKLFCYKKKIKKINKDKE